jgi:hypothetical protein
MVVDGTAVLVDVMAARISSEVNATVVLRWNRR